jgi:hypothetical protein
MNPHADIDSVSAYFPLLRSDEFSMKKNMDATIREIIQVLERCSKSETTFSDEERAGNVYLLDRVFYVDITLKESQAEGHEALLLLFRKRLATPDNLEMLLRMVDTDIQTGKIRCIAFLILGRIVQLDFVWSLKMRDGSCFSTSYIVACSKALENETNEDGNNRHTERSCECAHIAAIFLFTAMSMIKDAPVTVIERVHSFNWAQILSKANGIDSEPYDPCIWFLELHDLCMDVLKENTNHSLAREFLQKLEMCPDFFRRVLEYLVRLTRSLPSVSKEEIGNPLSHLALIRNVLRIYATRLMPPHNDPRTNGLVRLAHQTLEEARPSVMAALQDPTVGQIGFGIEDYYELMFHTSAQQWVRVKSASDSLRRQRFEAALHEHISDRKTSRRDAKKTLKNAAIGKDAMCASCYVLESEMGKGKTLSKCGWCKQVTYCSRECQKLHWNKAHKKECAGRKK